MKNIFINDFKSKIKHFANIQNSNNNPKEIYVHHLKDMYDLDIII